MKHIFLSMMMISMMLIASAVLIAGCVQQSVNPSSYELNGLTIKWLGHSSFEVTGNNTTIYFDPFILGGNPDLADYILITHDHFDHCSLDQVKKIERNNTEIISTLGCVQKLTGKTNSANLGDSFNYTFYDVYAEAYSAYTFDMYHPKGEGLGFLLIINGTKIYHAGDTDNIPEFENLTKEKIDVLLLPIGGKYTMDIREAVAATRAIKPRIVIPMHFNSGNYGINDIDADPQQFKSLLKDSGIEVIILNQAVEKSA